jgi:hypothetical protein
VEDANEERKRFEAERELEVRQLQEQIREMGDSAGAAFYYGNAAHAEDVMKLKGQVNEL